MQNEFLETSGARIIGDTAASLSASFATANHRSVTITNCTFNGLIYACIVMGSETSGAVRKVKIEHGLLNRIFCVKLR